MINDGTVNANVNAQTLTLLTNNMTNSATFEATNSGTLSISGITVTQSSGGQISAIGAAGTASFVTLSGGAIVSAEPWPAPAADCSVCQGLPRSTA